MIHSLRREKSLGIPIASCSAADKSLKWGGGEVDCKTIEGKVKTNCFQKNETVGEEVWGAMFPRPWCQAV